MFRLAPHPSGEPGKQLPREVAGIGWIGGILTAKVIVEDSPIGGLVNVRETEIHPVAFDCADYATDEDHRAILLLALDDSDVRQRIVHLAIPVVVPCIVKEDKVAGMDDRPLVERTLLLYMRMDNSDAVSIRLDRFTVVEVDPVFEKHCTGHSRTVVIDAPAVAFNRFSAYEFGRCLCDSAPAWHTPDGSATEALCR